MKLKSLSEDLQVENVCLLEPLSSNRNVDIIKYQLQELKKLKQSLQLDVYKEINSMICYKKVCSS